MNTKQLTNCAVKALDDLKGRDVRIIDVRSITTVTDVMVIASGTSDRHVKALAGNVITEAKKAGVSPLGIEGEDTGDWVLVDLGDVVVHVMRPAVREFYNLEKLWTVPVKRKSEAP